MKFQEEKTFKLNELLTKCKYVFALSGGFNSLA